jgi:alginate O-acetyltransferase complex protein AlgI
MLFNSLDFIIFLAVVLLAVWAGGLRLRSWILLVASLVFYGWWEWRYLLLLLFNCLVAYGSALGIATATSPQRRKAWCAAGVTICLGLLAFFKYRGFFLENVTALLASLGMASASGPVAIILPIGISFFTFQAVAYVVDVYRGITPASWNFRDFLLFKSFFPQLVAGPIERAHHLLPQIQHPRRATNAEIIEGLYLVLWGFCKKVVVADNLALKVNRIFDQSSFSTADVIIGALGFGFQIYADFSGYTDIARGVARWFGIRLSENFRFPYFATNPQDFWRRWHITLSTWLREYVYIPLGGNRHGRGRTSFNLFLTMLLGGLWHGAAWNFVLWGAYQGALLIAHRAWTEWRGERRHSHASRIASIFVMFAFTLYGWLLFRLGSFDQIASATAALGRLDFGPDFLARLARLMPYIGLVLLVDLVSFLARDPWVYVRRHPVLVAAFFLFLFYCILIVGNAGGGQFIYFAF